MGKPRGVPQRQMLFSVDRRNRNSPLYTTCSMTQRDMMRRLVKMFGPDWDRVCLEYALAEVRGAVPRHSNRHNLTGGQYARALLGDGQRKGWL